MFWRSEVPSSSGSRGPTNLPTTYETEDNNTQNIKIRNAYFEKAQNLTSIRKHKIYSYSNSLMSKQ
jgi:hypothetical protein